MNGNDSKIESEFLTNLNKFRQINFFAGIPPEAVKIIAFLCQREFYQKGDVIFNQNDDDGCAYYILDGKASIFRKRDSGREKIRTLEADVLIGILSILVPMPRQFSLEAETDTTCLIMTRDKFSTVLNQFPGVTLKIIKALGEKIIEAEKNFIRESESPEKEIKNLLGISLL